MTISVGDTLPTATMMTLGKDGPAPVNFDEKIKGRKVVVFAVPGPFSTTCDVKHLPSFMRNLKNFKAKGVEEVICLAVSDPWVVAAWGDVSGASKAGITMLSDPISAYTKEIGMNFSAEVVGFIDRSVRYAMLVEDGEVKILQLEEARGVCEATAGEALLAAMG